MEQKTALITGASHGIGKATAIALARAGYSVGVNYFHNEKSGLAVCDEINQNGGIAYPFKADISNYQQEKDLFTAFFDKFGSIDLMINNAGISKFYPFLEVTEEEWKEITFTDWKGAYFGTQFAARNMIANHKEGVIINISSNHVDGCWPDANIYGPTKAALTKFGKSAAMELAPYHIRVITVAPGYTDVDWPKDHPVQLAKQHIPLKRFAEPSEIAEIIVFLASDKCRYMTGNCVTIDGGALLPILPENYEFIEEQKHENHQN